MINIHINMLSHVYHEVDFGTASVSFAERTSFELVLCVECWLISLRTLYSILDVSLIIYNTSHIWLDQRRDIRIFWSALAIYNIIVTNQTVTSVNYVQIKSILDILLLCNKHLRVRHLSAFKGFCTTVIWR